MTADTLQEIATADSLPPGQCRTVEVRGLRLALCNVDGQFFATDDHCPHRGGPMGAGHLEGCLLHCPLHGWAFDVRTGACQSNPAKSIRSFPTTVQDGRVWVNLG